MNVYKVSAKNKNKLIKAKKDYEKTRDEASKMEQKVDDARLFLHGLEYHIIDKTASGAIDLKYSDDYKYFTSERVHSSQMELRRSGWERFFSTPE
jgi:hypothetical protein